MKKASLPKTLLKNLLPTLLFLLGLELLCQAVYFQKRSEETFGLEAAVHDLAQILRSRTAEEGALRAYEDLPPIREIYRALLSPMGEGLRAELEERYHKTFRDFVSEVEATDSLLLVLYIPGPANNELDEEIERFHREFFHRITSENGVPLLDLTDDLGTRPTNWLYLTPENFHLSRLGNRLVAQALAQHLRKPPFADHRSSWQSPELPKLFGDLPPSTRQVWDDRKRPFLVTTNRQGLRMEKDLSPQREAQRILLLGDSFTFGIQVHDSETYPAFLTRFLRPAEVLNAGMPGYSIPQEAELFHERARHTAPDVTVLQVLFNDLFGLLAIERNLYRRDSHADLLHFTQLSGSVGDGPFEPTVLEQAFLEELRSRENSPTP